MTLTGPEVERMPSESRATAVRVCHPSAAVVVAQVTEYGAVVVSAPRLTPSSWNCTPATPNGEPAFAVTVTVPPTRTPEGGEVMVTPPPPPPPPGSGNCANAGSGDSHAKPTITNSAAARASVMQDDAGIRRAISVSLAFSSVNAVNPQSMKTPPLRYTGIRRRMRARPPPSRSCAGR